MTQPAKPRENRSSLIFAVGLLIAAALAVSMDASGRYFSMARSGVLDLSTERDLNPLPPRELTEKDREAAKIAWDYLVRNTRPETGFVDSVAGYPSTTLWDQGSYLLGVLSAEQIGLIGREEVGWRVNQFLDSMMRMPLFQGQLPNKAYHTQTLAMVDYGNNESQDGIGWSALDLARMLSAFRVLERRAPEFGDRVREVLGRWDLEAMVDNGELWGTMREDGETQYLQEGRIGYEQYGARAAALWGLDVIAAISVQRALDWETVSGVDVPVDIRTFSAFRAITPTLSEPYMLQGLELGLDSEGAQMAERVYQAQEARWRATGQHTMVSEDHINQAPYFLYNSVHSNGEAWAVVTEKGENHPDLRTVSLKAAFAWDALYNTDYTIEVREALAHLGVPGEGWSAGIYETNGELNDVKTLNTNGIVLEAIHYIAYGPLWRS